jgi:hypothetical protein
VALLLLATKVDAQIAGTGNIQGTVTDTSGAVVAFANVTLIEVATDVKHETKTDNAGIYVFPNIPIATYNLVVTVPGFETYEQTGIVLEVGSSIAVNPRLAIGKADTKIEVKSGEVQQLQTEDPTYKQTLDSEEILEMPLNSSNGRLVTNLLTLTGGTNTAPANDFANGSKYNYQTQAWSINGGMGNAILWRLDGADNGDYMAGGNLPLPFPDALSQFTQESSVMGAQDGMKAGGMINVVTKSGTNQFHGNAFEYIRNDFIDASSFFSNTHDRLHQNEVGGTIGGPVWIPKLYNGKNKLFFFAGFHYLSYHDVASNQTATVPTAAELAGDFRVENGDPINGVAPNVLCSTKPLKQLQLADPITGALVENSAGQGNVYNTFTPNASSKALLAYLPPVVPLASGLDACGGIQYAIPSEHYDKQFITREDYNTGAKDNLYGRYFVDSYQVPGFYSPTNILVTSQVGNPEERVQTGTIGENHVFTTNLVNSAHIAVMRRYHTRAYNSADINACTGVGFNLVGVSCAVPNGLQLSTGGNGIGGFAIGNATNSPAFFNDNTGVIDDDLTWVKGKHLINIGGEYVRNQLNIRNAFTGVGVYGFGSNFSSYGPYGAKGTAANNPNSGITAVGNGQLDFLEGAMNDFSQGKEQQNALRSTIPALYVQDTFHVTRKLTLVAGIRWDPNFMPTDVFNRGATFSNAAFLAGTTSTMYPTAPAGVLFYGDPGVPKSFTASSPNQWDPNFGFTFDPRGDGKTVIRGGGEYIYDTANTFTAQREQQNPPFATGVNQSTNTYDPFTDPWLTVPSDIPTPSAGAGAVNSGTLTSNPFPTAASFVGKPTAAAALFPKNSTWIVLPAKFHIATYAQWNASIQHDFPHGWQMQLQYVGSKGTHEEGGLPLDPVVWIPGVSTGVAGPANCNVSINGTNYYLGEPGSSAVPKAGANCSTTSNNTQRGMLTLENPGQGILFGQGTTSDIVGDFAFSTYEGGIFSVNHRLSNVFSMFANFTWSKCLDVEDNQGDISGVQVENPNNPKADYGPCGSDLRKVFNTSIVATSRFHMSNRVASYLLNNWVIGALSSAHSGGVLNVTPGSDISLTAINNDRANLIPGVPVYQKAKFSSVGGEANREFLNPAAFAIPALTATTSAVPTYGNISRNEFNGLPFISLDGQISRYWPIHENIKLDTRIDAFDILNHPDFSCCQSTSVASSTFGQVSSTAYGPRQFQGSLNIIF